MVTRMPLSAIIFASLLSFLFMGMGSDRQPETAEQYLAIAKSYEGKVEQQNKRLLEYERTKQKYEKELARPIGHKHKMTDPVNLKISIRYYEAQIQKTKSKINEYEGLVKSYRNKARELQKGSKV